jgi:hypothetical protein
MEREEANNKQNRQLYTSKKSVAIRKPDIEAQKNRGTHK